MAGMAWTSTPMEGPSAAGLRSQIGSRNVRWTEHSHDARLSALCDGMLRDETPPVRKAMRRVMRAWGQDHPAAVVAWSEQVRGGLPKMLRAEVDRAKRALKRESRS